MDVEKFATFCKIIRDRHMADTPEDKPKSKRPRRAGEAARPQAIVSPDTERQLKARADSLQKELERVKETQGETLGRGALIGYLCYWFLAQRPEMQKTIILGGRLLADGEGFLRRIPPAEAGAIELQSRTVDITGKINAVRKGRGRPKGKA